MRWKTACLVLAVTIDGLPCTAPDSQRDQPVALALPLVGGELVHVLRRSAPAGHGRRRERRAPGRRSVPARPAACRRRCCPLRGQPGDRRTPARWSQTRSRSHRWEIPDQVDAAGRLLSFRPKCPARM